MIFKMHVYTHIYKGGENRKYGSRLPEQAKQLKTFDHAAIYCGQQANEEIQFQSRIMHGIYNVQKYFLKNSWKEEYTFSMRGEVFGTF